MELSANISSLKELDVALSSGANGVGLFRTEFLYMDRSRSSRAKRSSSRSTGASRRSWVRSR